MTKIADGDAALAFLRHVVGRGVAVVHFPDFVGFARVIEDALGRRGFAGVDMRRDADIANLLERDCSGHDCLRRRVPDARPGRGRNPEMGFDFQEKPDRRPSPNRGAGRKPARKP